MSRDDFWNVLLIEDDESDYFITGEFLKHSRRGSFNLNWASTYQDGIEKIISGNYDVVLVDYNLGARSGVELIQEAVAQGCQLPFLLMTGQGNYEVDMLAMQAGAVDYLVKNDLNADILERSIRYAIDRKRIEGDLASANQKLAQAYDELSQERQRLNALIQYAPSAILMTDRDGKILYVNPAAENLLNFKVMSNGLQPEGGFTIHHLDGSSFPPDELPLNRSIRNGVKTESVELLVRFNSGREVIVQKNSAPILNEAGKVTGAVAVMQDITRYLQMEAQVRETTENMNIQREILKHREDERQQIARDLHDGPIQDLISLLFSIQTVLTLTQDQEVIEVVDSIREDTQKLVADLRGVCNDLRPPTLVQFGLAKAIRSHASEFEEKHKDIRVHLSLMDDRLVISDDVRLALFRVYQESLNNVVRHARASEVQVRLEVGLQQVKMEIRDNGVGFKAPSDWLNLARHGHLGLVGMKERVESVQGKLEITSPAGGGTLVSITVPIVVLQETGKMVGEIHVHRAAPAI